MDMQRVVRNSVANVIHLGHIKKIQVNHMVKTKVTIKTATSSGLRFAEGSLVVKILITTCFPASSVMARPKKVNPTSAYPDDESAIRVVNENRARPITSTVIIPTI